MDWAKTTARRDEKYLSFCILRALYWRFYGRDLGESQCWWIDQNQNAIKCNKSNRHPIQDTMSGPNPIILYDILLYITGADPSMGTVLTEKMETVFSKLLGYWMILNWSNTFSLPRLHFSKRRTIPRMTIQHTHSLCTSPQSTGNVSPGTVNNTIICIYMATMGRMVIL